MNYVSVIVAVVFALFATNASATAQFERPYSPKVYQWDDCKAPNWSCNSRDQEPVVEVEVEEPSEPGEGEGEGDKE